MLYAGGGGVVGPKRDLADMLCIDAEQVRVVAHDVGGNFGTRNYTFPEFSLVAWASRRVDRPVKWIGDRTVSFLSDYHGRDLAVKAELALDVDGRFLRSAPPIQQCRRLPGIVHPADEGD